MFSLSSASSTEKPRRRPARSCSICRNFRPSAWNVHTVSACASSALTSLLTRSRISRAALLVKVIAAIFDGASFRRCTRCAIFWVITDVLPEPAPASTSSGLSTCSTAANCWGLSMRQADRSAGNSAGRDRSKPAPGGAGLRSIRPNGSGSRYHAPFRTSGARMAKLYFYYSAMNAGKTTNLLQSAYNYYERGMRTLILTPALDNRYGEGVVASRIGLRSLAQRFAADIDLL